MAINWTAGLRQAQQAALEFCANYTKCAIGVFEPNSDGDIQEFLPLHQSEPYCRKLRSMPEGDRLCRADHIRRVKDSIKSGEPQLTLCHAGVFNQALPIKMGDEVPAVFLYGEMKVENDYRLSRAKKLHEDMITKLNLGEKDEPELRAYYNEIKQLSKEDLQHLNKQLSLLQRLFYEMVSEEKERGRQTEIVIHDLQMRLQPALAHAEALKNSLRLLDVGLRKITDIQTDIQKDTENLLNNLMAMRAMIWNLGNFLPTYEFTKCSIKGIVEESILLYGAEAERKEIEFRRNIKEPANLLMSRAHMQLAVNNLIHNAIKYSFHGRYDITRYIEIHGEIIGSDYSLSITNYGVGIIPEEYDLIFAPGAKGKLAQEEYRSGAGMGLAIAKEVIEKHKGSINVESYSTGGKAYLNKFTIRLPRG
jgi:signal transduction histidine kinase